MQIPLLQCPLLRIPENHVLGPCQKLGKSTILAEIFTIEFPMNPFGLLFRNDLTRFKITSSRDRNRIARFGALRLGIPPTPDRGPNPPISRKRGFRGPKTPFPLALTEAGKREFSVKNPHSLCVPLKIKGDFCQKTPMSGRGEKGVLGPRNPLCQAVLHGVPLTGWQLFRWERVLLTLWIKGLSTWKSEVKLSPPSGAPPEELYDVFQEIGIRAPVWGRGNPKLRLRSSPLGPRPRSFACHGKVVPTCSMLFSPSRCQFLLLTSSSSSFEVFRNETCPM